MRWVSIGSDQAITDLAAVDEDPGHRGGDLRRAAIEHDHVAVLAGLEGADAIVDAEHAGRVEGEAANGRLGESPGHGQREHAELGGAFLGLLANATGIPAPEKSTRRSRTTLLAV